MSVPKDDPKKHLARGLKPDEPDRGKGLAEMFRDMEAGDMPDKKTDEPPT